MMKKCGFTSKDYLIRLTAYPLCKVAGSELALKRKQGLELYLNCTHEHMHVKHPKPRHNTSRYDKGSWEDSKDTRSLLRRHNNEFKNHI